MIVAMAVWAVDSLFHMHMGCASVYACSKPFAKMFGISFLRRSDPTGAYFHLLDATGRSHMTVVACFSARTMIQEVYTSGSEFFRATSSACEMRVLHCQAMQQWGGRQGGWTIPLGLSQGLMRPYLMRMVSGGPLHMPSMSLKGALPGSQFCLITFRVFLIITSHTMLAPERSFR